MIDHVSIGVREVAKAKRFYDAAFAPLGYRCLSESPGGLGYGRDAVAVYKARRYDALSYADVLRQDLRIMDGAAIALARDNRIPIIVFSIKEQGGLAAVLQGKGSSTTIS